jgi:hypothetical protein
VADIAGNRDDEHDPKGTSEMVGRFLDILTRVMDQANPVDSGSGGGIAGTHPEVESAPIYVGPATAAQRNTIISPLVPIACWRVDDIRFDFDSSFVLPETTSEMQALADLRDKHTLHRWAPTITTRRSADVA